MDIRDKLIKQLRQRTDHETSRNEMADFILSKETLELLKPLYGVDMDKIAKMTCIMEKDEFLKTLSDDGDVVKVGNLKDLLWD